MEEHPLIFCRTLLDYDVELTHNKYMEDAAAGRVGVKTLMRDGPLGRTFEKCCVRRN